MIVIFPQSRSKILATINFKMVVRWKHLYSVGVWFEFQLRHELPWMRFYPVFLSLQENSKTVLSLVNYNFFPNPSRSIVSHRTIRRCMS